MKIKPQLINAVLIGALAASPVFARKFRTDIPSAITIPDSVETRLGTLKFEDGFPDDATVQKVYDNLDFQRGVQAFLTAMPAASLSAMREGLRSIGVNNSTVALFETLMDSKSLFLMANTESVYLVGWLDLKEGPMVIESAPNVLGFVDDFWFHYVTDMGNAGPDKGQGGKFVILPPDYQGAEPPGYFVSRSKTYGNWFIMRGFLVNGGPSRLSPVSSNVCDCTHWRKRETRHRRGSSTHPVGHSTPFTRWTSPSSRRSTAWCRKSRTRRSTRRRSACSPPSALKRANPSHPTRG
jgi:hypothetical protein